MMDYSELLWNAEDFATGTYGLFEDRQFAYHNLSHTKQVVSHCKEIGGFYQLNEEDFCALLVAAWFHDIGHLFGVMEGHEEKGVSSMQECMQMADAPASIIATSAACIRATKIGAHPETLLEDIICDADTYHFGTDYFKQTDPLVKQEMELRLGKIIPDWWAKTIVMLQQHQFYTEYCRRLLDAGKQMNILWLQTEASG